MGLKNSFYTFREILISASGPLTGFLPRRRLFSLYFPVVSLSVASRETGCVWGDTVQRGCQVEQRAASE